MNQVIYKLNNGETIEISNKTFERWMRENTDKNDFDYSFRLFNSTAWFGINKSGIYLYKNKNISFTIDDIRKLQETTMKTPHKKYNTMDLLDILRQ